jgi:hypothetical protein
MLPLPVNLTALPARLSRIWRTRPPSPRTVAGRLRPRRVTTIRPFSSAAGEIRAAVSARTALRSKSTGSRTTLPASILEKSRMSLMTPSRALPAEWMPVA